MIFDSHIHLEGDVFEKNVVGFDNYNLDITGGNLIVNFLELFNLYRDTINNSSKRYTLTCIFDFRSKDNIDQFNDRVERGEIHGAKIHSKIQKIYPHEYQFICSRIGSIPDHIPITLDGWYDWHDLSTQPSLEHNIMLALKFPQKKFIIAHAGGAKILDYFLHTRKINNIYYDLSLTLGYFKGSSVWKDVKHFVKYTPSDRIMYGSDYPYYEPNQQLNRLQKIIDKLKLGDHPQQNILYNTANSLYNIT